MIMNQELLKKLRDAGFPTHAECGECGYDGIAQHKPTLSELIKSCGDRFCNLEKIDALDGTWVARTFEPVDKTQQFKNEFFGDQELKFYLHLNVHVFLK